MLPGTRSPQAEVGDGSSQAGEGAATASHDAGKGRSRAEIHPREQQQDPACLWGKVAVRTHLWHSRAVRDSLNREKRDGKIGIELKFLK